MHITKFSLINLNTGEELVDVIPVTHKTIGENKNILCLKFKNEDEKLGMLYMVESPGRPVTCQECLELIHS